MILQCFDIIHTDGDNLLRDDIYQSRPVASDDTRYITFKYFSSCPYKEEFYDTLSAMVNWMYCSWNNNRQWTLSSMIIVKRNSS